MTISSVSSKLGTACPHWIQSNVNFSKAYNNCNESTNTVRARATTLIHCL